MPFIILHLLPPAVPRPAPAHLFCSLPVQRHVNGHLPLLYARRQEQFNSFQDRIA